MSQKWFQKLSGEAVINHKLPNEPELHKLLDLAKENKNTELFAKLQKYSIPIIHKIIKLKPNNRWSILEQAIYWKSIENDPIMMKKLEELPKSSESVAKVSVFQSSTSTKINYLTYNILVGLPKYESSDALPNSKPEYRSWDNRFLKIKDVISKSDIGVLVESLESKLSQILPDNYKYIFQSKISDCDGTTIFFNPEKFNLIAHYSKQILKGNNQVVLLGIFKEITTNKLFAIIGLHLKSGYEPEEKRRQEEINVSLQDCLKFLKEYGDIPIILSGDLNSDSLGGYKRLTLSKVKTFGFNLIPLINNEITYNHHQTSIFDYIFIKGDIKYSNSSTGVSLEGSTPSPNETQGSDHFPLFAELEL
jgi:hypothetical protein